MPLWPGGVGVPNCHSSPLPLLMSEGRGGLFFLAGGGCSDFPWASSDTAPLPSGDGERFLVTASWDWMPRLLMVSLTSKGRGRGQDGRDESPGSLLSLFWYHWSWGTGAPYCSLVRGTSLGSPLDLSWWWGRVGPQVFLCCLPGVERLLCRSPLSC